MNDPVAQPSGGKFLSFLDGINWGDVIGSIGQAGVAGWFGQQQFKDQQRINQETLAIQEKQKMDQLMLGHQQEMEKARLLASLGAYGGGGGSGSAAAMANVRRQAKADQAQTLLQGADLKSRVLDNFLMNVQRPGLR